MDTQDFSRFGRVIEGRGDADSRASFGTLIDIAERGEARFVYSMATLSELLQYDPDFEATSLAKAEAIERLCKGNAMANLMRLVAFEVGTFAAALGLIPKLPFWNPALDEDYWFPDLGAAFDTFRERFNAARSEALKQFSHMNRHERRHAEKALSERAFKKFADETAREVEREYGVRSGDFVKAFGPYARGKINSNVASQKLFSAVSRPTAFVEFYFKKWEGEKDLPFWLQSAGRTIQTGIEKMVRQLSEFDIDDVRNFHPAMLETWRPQLASSIAGFALKNGNEFNLSDDTIQAVQVHPDILKIDVCRNLVELIGEYVAQCIGLRGTKAKVESSFGGDLLHAAYIPHVDIWRGDKRFSKLVQDCAIGGTTQIAPTLRSLPDAIASFS